MFEQFGEFDSYEELNAAAKGQKERDYRGALNLLAKENGIPEELVELYWEGIVEELTDAETAAVGKLDAEMEDIKKRNRGIAIVIYQDIADVLKMFTDNQEYAKAIRKKGKSLEGALKKILEAGKKSERLQSQNVGNVGYVGTAQTLEILRKYYLGY